MLNLFAHRQLLELSPSTSHNFQNTSIKLAVFGVLSPGFAREDAAVNSRLVLYCDDGRLLLVQFTTTGALQQLWIPTDGAKGSIICMVLNANSTALLALTSQSYLYVIPFNFTLEADEHSSVLRPVLQEDARVLRCLALRSPTSLAWWQRPHAQRHASIALVGNSFGQLVFIDLETSIEFKLFTFPFGIDRLSIFEELYCQTLLISCSNKMQYQLTLEQFRSVINEPTRKKSTSSTISSGSYLMACVINFGGVGFEDEKGLYPDSMSSVLDSNEIKPQLISINEDSISPASTVTSGNQSEFFDLLEDSLKMSIHPQRHTRSVFVVKQNRPKYDFANISNNSRGEEASLSDSSDISATFCSVAVCRDLSLDVHEFRAEDFCTKTIILKDSKLFLVSMDADEPRKSIPPSSPAAHHQMLKIIDAGHRFFLLVYPTRIALVSKYFAEAKHSYSATSPRSPLLLKKSDSLRSSGGGSFRRKNIHHNSSSSGSGFSGSTASSTVLEEFKTTTDFNDDVIVDVFLVSTPTTGEPDLSALVHRDYPLTSSSSVGGGMTLVDLEAIHRSEKAAIETKLSPKIGELIRIEEKWIIVTTRRCYEMAAKDTDFGRYFHREVVQLLELVDEPGDSGAVDGDVITRAKYLVDAFVYRVCRFGGPVSSSSSSHPVQSWQFWLTRSALLLMESLTKSLPVGQEPPVNKATEAKFSQIFRLFELARTPRKRVITALTYFRFWSRALYYCRKYFESRILQELTDEERLYLAHQMLDCLLERYRRAMTNKTGEGENGGKGDAKKEASEALFAFFKTYRTYYDVGRTLERLLDCQLWSMARKVAVAQSDYLSLLHLILRKFSSDFETLPKESRSSILDLLTSHRLTYTLILSTRFQLSNESDFASPPSPLISSASSSSPTTSIRLIEEYLDFIIKALPNFSSAELYRLAAVLDPSRFEMQLLLNNVLEIANQTYLREGSARHVIESYLPIRKRDLLHLYIFVLLLCLRKAHHHQRKLNQSVRLYDWNFLDNVKSDFENFKYPQAQSLKVDIEEDSVYCVSTGTFHSAAFESSRSNILYIWGRFPYVKDVGKGSLLTRHLRTPYRMNFFNSLLPKVVIREVACGHQHSLILTDAGLFAMGSSTFGQLGLGAEVLEAKYPMTVALFQPGSTVKAVKIAAGSYHSLAISEEGHLWSWGYAIHGQLGHGIIEDEQTPRRIDFWDYSTVKVISVAAGYAHTVALTNTGEVYVFGDNSYSQLGMEMNDELTLESRVNKYVVPQKLTLESKLPGRVRLVACGLFHTIALVTTTEQEDTATERLFCWGLDPKTWRVKMRADRSKGSNATTTPTSGQHASVYEYAKVRQISLEKVSGKVSKIVAGQSHSVLLTDEGRCYTFGYGREGQLGLGSGIPSCPLVAEPILELEAIVDVAAGAVHSLAVNTEGTVWGWGQNADFQLDGCQPASILDASPGANNRRNSLLNSLMKRGDDQLMNRLMSLQKNVEWTPMRVQVPLLVTSNKSNASSSVPEPIEVLLQTRSCNFTTKNRAVMIKQQLMECLVRYRHLLDFKSMLKRFNQFDYPQLSAVVSHFLNDPITTYLYQLAALKQEIRVELLSLSENDLNEATAALFGKCTQEVCLLTTFFANRNPRIASADFFHLVNGMVKFADDVAEILTEPKFTSVKHSWSLKEILKRLYLQEDTCSIGSAYFGLAFFKVIQERELTDKQFRRRWSLVDELLLQLMERTQEAIKKCPTEMVTIQQLVQELVDVKDLLGCDSAKEHKLVQFPLELAWRKIMQQFAEGQNYQKAQKSIGFNLKEPSFEDEIELEIPSDEDESNLGEDKENCPLLLYVFVCGHGLTRGQLIKHSLPKDTNYIEAVEKLLLDGTDSTIIDILCPNCHSPH